MTAYVVASAIAIQGAHASDWDVYRTQFGKVYANQAEEEARLEIYKQNVAYIESENAKGHSYTLGVNQFTDMTHAEFVAKYLGYQQLALATNRSAIFLGSHSWRGESLLESIDWVAKNAVTPVKNQGQCGSCWSFSVTGALEGAWQIATGSLVSLSEQEFVDCDSGNDGCDGGNPPSALQWATQQSICTEVSYPYTAQDGRCSKSMCSVGIPSGSIVGVHDVQRDASSMKSALAGRPVSIAIDANHLNGYSSGIWDDCGYSGLNHAVLLVGYTNSYWKVKNSWGTSWGESGYVRMSNSGSGNCMGLLDQAAYVDVSGSPGPSPPGPAPGPSPPGPSPGPSPGPCATCTYNDDCPTGQDCYYPSESAHHGCCSSGPPWVLV